MHDDHNEQQPQVKQPRTCHARHRDAEKHQHDRARDRPKKRTGSTNHGCDQHRARAQHTDAFCRHQLDVDEPQRARDAREERRQHEHPIPHAPWIATRRRRAHRIVTHRIREPHERRARQRPHRERGEQAPARDHRIRFARRAKRKRPPRGAARAVDRHTRFTAEPVGQRPRRSRHELPDAKRDHRERSTRATRRDEARDRTGKRAAHAACKRQPR
ncbi:hypothetical protein R69919_01438 [Paraburkholderia gardini]|nr:hypothetical protein R69919_01438 [Paraburkholderia gardini]